MTPIEQQIEKVVDAILCDYQQQRDIDRLELKRKPDKDAIIDIIEKLRRIVFPGYFREKNYRVYNAKHNLSLLIEDILVNSSRCCSSFSLLYFIFSIPPFYKVHLPKSVSIL